MAQKAVLLGTENIFDHLRPILLDYLRVFTIHPEVVGIVILGGASVRRCHLDIHSDLDVSLFISVQETKDVRPRDLRAYLDAYQDTLPRWLPDFSHHVKTALHPDGSIEVNIHQHIIQVESHAECEWDEPKKQAYADSAELYYDPLSLLRPLIDAKTNWDDARARRKLLWVLGQAKWYGVINPQRQVDRGLVINAHDLLNEAVELIIWAIFLINKRYRPHKKWRFEATCKLPLVPWGFRESLTAALFDCDLDDLGAVYRRSQIIENLLQQVTELAMTIYDVTDDPYRASCFESFSDRQLLKRPRNATAANE